MVDAFNSSSGTTKNKSLKKVAGADDPVTAATLEKKVQELKDTIQTFSKPVLAIFTGVIIVLFMGMYATITATQALFTESNQSKEASYENLSDKVNDLIEQNKAAQDTSKDQQIKELQQEIKDLKDKNPYLK